MTIDGDMTEEYTNKLTTHYDSGQSNIKGNLSHDQSYYIQDDPVQVSSGTMLERSDDTNELAKEIQ